MGARLKAIKNRVLPSGFEPESLAFFGLVSRIRVFSSRDFSLPGKDKAARGQNDWPGYTTGANYAVICD